MKVCVRLYKSVAPYVMYRMEWDGTLYVSRECDWKLRGNRQSHFTHGKCGRKWPRRGFILNRRPAANYYDTNITTATVMMTVGSCWRQTSTRVLWVVRFSQVHKHFWKNCLLLLGKLAYTNFWLLISSLLKKFGHVKNYSLLVPKHYLFERFFVAHNSPRALTLKAVYAGRRGLYTVITCCPNIIQSSQ